jgi:hypothetical protein
MFCILFLLRDGLLDHSFLRYVFKDFIVNFDGSTLLPTLLPTMHTFYFIHSVIFNQMGN